MFCEVRGQNNNVVQVNTDARAARKGTKSVIASPDRGETISALVIASEAKQSPIAGDCFVGFAFSQ